MTKRIGGAPIMACRLSPQPVAAQFLGVETPTSALEDELAGWLGEDDPSGPGFARVGVVVAGEITYAIFYTPMSRVAFVIGCVELAALLARGDQLIEQAQREGVH
jgi:hypothetical protein